MPKEGIPEKVYIAIFQDGDMVSEAHSELDAMIYACVHSYYGEIGREYNVLSDAAWIKGIIADYKSGNRDHNNNWVLRKNHLNNPELILWTEDGTSYHIRQVDLHV